MPGCVDQREMPKMPGDTVSPQLSPAQIKELEENLTIEQKAAVIIAGYEKVIEHNYKMLREAHHPDTLPGFIGECSCGKKLDNCPTNIVLNIHDIDQKKSAIKNDF